MERIKQTNQYPRLFHIGTQKAGSTYLYNLLKDHPDIALSSLTEINFFNTHFEKGVDWYLNQFPGKGIRIDASPKYFMLGDVVAPRIKAYAEKYLDEQKPLFLLILRNPIDYLYSHFNLHRKHRYFENHPDKYPKLTGNLLDFVKLYPEYLERAYYNKILTQYWLPHFKSDQFKVIIFEEFIKNTESLIAEICEFWNLPVVSLKKEGVSKNRMLKYNFLFGLQKQIIKHAALKDALKSSRLFSAIYDKYLTEDSSEKLSYQTRHYLKEIFSDDVKKLEGLLREKILFWDDFRE